MPWKKLLACVTGQIDEALRQKLNFVLEENRVYRALLERHSPHWLWIAKTKSDLEVPTYNDPRQVEIGRVAGRMALPPEGWAR